MARLLFPTEVGIAGPWLVDSDQLVSLDQVFDRHMESLLAEKERSITQEVNREIAADVERGHLKEDEVDQTRDRRRQNAEHYARLREKRSVTIYLPKGKEVQSERFIDAVSQPIDNEEIPYGFTQFVRVGQIEVRIRLAASWGRDSLSIDVEPSHSEAAQALFGSLRNWASDVEAPKWQQRWLRMQALVGLLFVMWIVVGLVFVPLANWSDTGRTTARAEARRLLQDGIDPNNQQRALELLLAIESNYNPGVTSRTLRIRYWAYFSLGALFFGAASICPKVSIGVWGGRQQVKRWRSWTRAVSVTLPLLIVTSVLLPWLPYWLGLAPPDR